MPEPTNTGRNQFADGAKNAASALAGPALDLAQGATLTQAASNALSGAVFDKLLGPTAIFAGTMVGVLRTMKAVVDQSGLLERGLKRIASVQQIQGKFETLLKSAEAAQKRMEELYKFSGKSPFDFSDVAEGNRILQALTKGALASAEGMKVVGDAAAASGQSFSETAEKIGKLYAALKSGRSLDKVLFQLQMSGIVTDELAAKLETAELAGAGFESRMEMVYEVLRRSSGAMDHEMKTLAGLNKELDNKSKMMEQGFGAPFIEAEMKAIKNTIAATENLTPVLQKIAQDSAPVLQGFRVVKNSIVDATLATKGFADMMSVAWEVFKAGAISTAAAAFVTSSRALVKGSRAGYLGYKDRSKQIEVGKQSPEYVQGMAAAKAKGEEASASFAQGALMSAAALKAESLWMAASTRAAMLHSVALRMAKGSGDAFRMGTYLSVMATGTLKGAWAAVLPVLKMVGRGFAAAFGHPVIAAGAALAGLGLAAVSYAEKMAAAIEANNKFVLSLSGARAEIRQMIADMKTMDDYRKARERISEEKKTVRKHMEELGAAPSKTTDVVTGTNYADMKVKSVANPAYAEWEDRKREINRQIQATKEFEKSMEAKLPGLAPGSREEQRMSEQVEADTAAKNAAEQAKIDRASQIQRRYMLQKRYFRLQREAAIGKDVEDALINPEKRAGTPSELGKLATEIQSRRERKQAVPEEMLRRQFELVQMSKNWRGSLQQAEQDRNELLAASDSTGMELTRVASERESNRAASRGDEFGARAATDANDLERLRSEYAALGLSRDQADSDFADRIMAEANRGQRIVADSKQSIGGGGGFGGANPMLMAQQRIQAAAEAHTRLLETIAENTRSPGTMDLD